jgi:hypothetical protein
MSNSKTGTFFHILSKSLLTDHPGMRNYSACATDRVIEILKESQVVLPSCMCLLQ